jgi:hypothetical protein
MPADDIKLRATNGSAPRVKHIEKSGLARAKKSMVWLDCSGLLQKGWIAVVIEVGAETLDASARFVQPRRVKVLRRTQWDSTSAHRCQTDPGRPARRPRKNSQVSQLRTSNW